MRLMHLKSDGEWLIFDFGMSTASECCHIDGIVPVDSDLVNISSTICLICGQECLIMVLDILSGPEAFFFFKRCTIKSRTFSLSKVFKPGVSSWM